MRTILEAVPPELHRGQAAVEAVIEKVAAVSAGCQLDAINIPEIHEEPSRSSKGERRQPFAPRMAPRELARVVRDRLGLECMINHVVVHHDSPASLCDWAQQTWEEYGVQEFVLVGGGRHDIAYPGPAVPQANQLLREKTNIPKLRIGNICIPSRDDEASRMATKVQAGADFFTTQILYEPDHFIRTLDGLQQESALPEEVLVAVCPAQTERNIRFLLWLGVSIPETLQQWLTEADVPARSIEQISRTWAAILDRRMASADMRPQIGVNLAPIGAITAQTTIALAADLAAMHAKRLNTV